MTLAASIALLSAGIALYVAILARQFSRAPGWQDQRHFALAAVAVSGFAILNIPTTAPILFDAVKGGFDRRRASGDPHDPCYAPPAADGVSRSGSALPEGSSA